MKKTVVATVLATIASVSFGFDTNNPPPNTPSGWSMTENYKNVKIYRKGTETTYLQVVDMSQGARVKLMQYQAGVVNTHPTWWINDISYWWNQMGDATTSRVSVVNGQFFDNSGWTLWSGWNSQKNPTTVSFGIKSNGAVLTNGGDTNANGGYPLRQIEFHSTLPTLTTWTSASLTSSSAPNAIVGLDPRADKKKSDLVGRTYLCTLPYYFSYRQLTTNLLVVYVAANKTQANAEADLAQWGCSQARLVMMDGSGSTKLRTKGGVQFNGNDSRKIPQAIGIYK